MSRVGKTIIKIPAMVSVTLADEGRNVTVTGPGGTLNQVLKTPIWAEVNNGEITVKRVNDANESKALHGLYNRLIQNMIKGVTTGFTRNLILNGVGYKIAMKGQDLSLSLGLSHIVEVKAEPGIKFKIVSPTEIQVQGISKEQVGAVASKIRGLRPVEPYHMYGIRYNNERVIRKESKSGKKKGK